MCYDVWSERTEYWPKKEELATRDWEAEKSWALGKVCRWVLGVFMTCRVSEQPCDLKRKQKQCVFGEITKY